ncbi:MAG: hypothetical protein R6X25_12085 [Candidatus Krumholzibacteriia bacterium]
MAHQLRVRAAVPFLSTAGAVLLLAIAGCEIQQPELPTFTTAVSLPLGEERLDMRDFVDDEDYLTADPDGALRFTVDGTPDTVSLDFDLAVDVPAASTSADLGDFVVDLPAVAYSFALADLFPPAAGLDGFVTVVPPFTCDIASEAEPLEGVSAIVVAAGTLRLTVTNGLPVPFSGSTAPEAVVLQLLDGLDGTPVFEVPVPEIAAGGTIEVTGDLAGVTAGGTLAVRLTGGSPGSGDEPVTIDAAAVLAVDVAFTAVTATAATARVPPQIFGGEMSWELPAGYRVGEALIAAGGSRLVVDNETDIACHAVVLWPDLFDHRGFPLLLQLDLAPGERRSLDLDLGGHTLRAEAGALLEELRCEVSVTMAGSGDVEVDLRGDQGLSVDVAAGSLEFASVTGVVPGLTVPLSPIVETVDLPDELDGVELTAAMLVLTITTSAGVPATAELTLTGTSATGVERTLDVTATIAPAGGRGPSSSTVVLDQHDSSIVEFLNNLPTEVSLAGEVLAGGGDVVGTMSRGDWAALDWAIEAPAEVIITGAVIRGEPEPLDLDDGLAERIRAHAGSARVTTEVSNHFPMAVELRILAARDTARIRTEPLLVIGPAAVAAGTVDPVTHVCVAPVVSRPVVELEAAQARLLGEPGMHVLVEVRLPSTGGLPVRVLASDHLTVSGLVRIEVEVDDTW